jgi:hypothetical protein
MNPATQNLNMSKPLSSKIKFNTSSHRISWYDMAVRAWSGEYTMPDRGVYEFSNGRKFDSTDQNATGIYSDNLGTPSRTPS